LQGHIDMVPQKNSDKTHDFEKDPIEMVVGEDGWVRANGTTLGADNGIGCAAAMAILTAKDLEHGPIEVLITIDEETGMTGAFGLQAGEFKGDILMNLDSETEGELYVGCAGGLDGSIEKIYHTEPFPNDAKAYRIFISKAEGGHSGMDIHLGRANANKLMTRLLMKSIEEYNIRIATIHGGSLRNAIPREAEAIVAVPVAQAAAFEQMVAAFANTLKKEFALTDPKLEIEIQPVDAPKEVVVNEEDMQILQMAYAIPHGVLRMSNSMKDLVETSNNFAIFTVENGKAELINLIRSSVDSAKDAVGEKMKAIAQMASATISLTGGYPGWNPNMKSPILNTMLDVYKKMFNKTPEVKAIHAGLECGLLGGVYPNWDMISFGPTIQNPHSPSERVNIESVEKFWNFLTQTLKNVPTK